MKEIDVVEAQLNRVLGFFPRVDTKVVGLFTINSALLTISVLNVEAGDLKQWYIALPAIFLLIGLIASYVFVYRGNFPTLDGGQRSLIYFAEIQKRTEANFIAEYEAVSDEDYRADMLSQVWRNSQILNAKYESVAIATRLTLATLLPFSVFLLVTAVQHTRLPVVSG